MSVQLQYTCSCTANRQVCPGTSQQTTIQCLTDTPATNSLVMSYTSCLGPALPARLASLGPHFPADMGPSVWSKMSLLGPSACSKAWQIQQCYPHFPPVLLHDFGNSSYYTSHTLFGLLEVLTKHLSEAWYMFRDLDFSGDNTSFHIQKYPINCYILCYVVGRNLI